MANESTTTTITGIITTSYIARTLLNYAIDPFVAFSRLRMEPVTGQGTKTAAFAVPTKDTALSAIITEATGLTATAMDFANTTVAVAEVGILRQITKLARRTNILGESGLYQFLIEDGGRMCMEKHETDAWAQWDNASTVAGLSGQALTLSNLAAAISQRAINKAKGNAVFFLTTTQTSNMRSAVLSTDATAFASGSANELLHVTQDDGYVGRFFGVPIFTNTLAATSGVDKVGVLMTDGEMSPANAATGCAMGWMPEPESVNTPELPGYKVAITMAYGLGEINDYQYTKLVTIA